MTTSRKFGFSIAASDGVTYEFAGLDAANLDAWRRALEPCVGNSNPDSTVRGLPMIVYFVGGVVAGELAAIRQIAEREQRQIIVATTGFVTGDSLLRSFGVLKDV